MTSCGMNALSNIGSDNNEWFFYNSLKAMGGFHGTN